ncbi:MAG TPA: hypothetical protein VEG33_13660, partial [Streptosporangiaceae bacterium]|nr:hypothetical protein [Streptosporangiaceae bacterium]
ERHRAAAQREVDELSKQKESISTHLAQISQLLGTQMPGLADALKPNARPAVAAAAPKAVAPPPAAPAQAAPGQTQSQAQAQPAPAASQAPAGGAPKQPVPAKAAKSNDEEWWTE